MHIFTEIGGYLIRAACASGVFVRGAVAIVRSKVAEQICQLLFGGEPAATERLHRFAALRYSLSRKCKLYHGFLISPDVRIGDCILAMTTTGKPTKNSSTAI